MERANVLGENTQAKRKPRNEQIFHRAIFPAENASILLAGGFRPL
jgi:hypothetical protein